VWDGTAWTETHRQWLAGHVFEQVNTEVAFVDNLSRLRRGEGPSRALDERLCGSRSTREF
jgi:hypothetical protein